MDSIDAPIDHLRLILLQARDHDDPMLHHEVECFSQRLGLPAERLECRSILENPTEVIEEMTEDPNAVFFIGGSGLYSVTQGGPPRLASFIEKVIPRIIENQCPTLGSCWGLHALITGGGGRLLRGEAEMGTWEVNLSERGQSDPLFADFPDTFHAQLGHKDWVVELPDGSHSLCHNDLSPNQAVRFGDGHVYGLQFHPELDEHANRSRFMYYIDHYSSGDAGDILSSFKPSPSTNTLLRRFLKIVAEV